MKVLIFNSLFPPNVVGGAEKSIGLLAQALATVGVEVSVASLTQSRRYECDYRGSVRTCYLPLANLYWPFSRKPHRGIIRALWHGVDICNPWMAKSLRQCIAAEMPDIIHTNNLAGFSIAAWRAAREFNIPVVHTLRDYYLMCVRSTRYRSSDVCSSTCCECWIPATVRNGASRLVTGVVGNSRYILTKHIENGFFPEARFRDVVYSCTDAKSGVYSRTESQTVRFGYFGQIERSKGVEMLIASFARRMDTGWSLTIAGRGAEQYVSQLKARTGAPQIRWTGWMDPESFFSELDVLIVPSLWEEPLPRVILEAYHHGVPVIATARGGIPEVVDDGVSGLLFEPTGPSSLDRIIDRILESRALLSRLRQGATVKARMFTCEQTLAGYLRAYKAVSGK
jgi:glycosyltransferase involved in cell wall biosynthesis